MRLTASGIALLLAAAIVFTGCSTVPESSPLIALEVESVVNTPDGCVSCGCRLSGALEPGATQQFWLVYGLVPDAGEQPARTSPAAGNYCGHGAYRPVQNDFTQVVGVPYVVIDLTIDAGPPGGAQVDLDVGMVRQEFTGFDAQGVALYAESRHRRSTAMQM